MLAKSVRRILVVNYYTASAILIIINAILLSCDPPLKAYNPLNTAPEIPSNLIPADNTVSQNTNVTLSWHCADPDGDTLKYDIYFGSMIDPPLAISGISDTTYSLQYLEFNTIFFWQVIAYDSRGDTSSSPIYSFKTRSFSDIQLIGSTDIPFGPSEWYSLTASGPNVFLAGNGLPLLIYDIADPSGPALVAQYGDQYLFISQIVLKNQIAFLVEMFRGLEMVDISNPQNPVHIGEYREPGITNCVVLVDSYAYLGGAGAITTLDISDPANTIPLDTSRVAVGIMKISGEYAYSVAGCGFEQSCLSWFEIHNRTSFEQVGSLELSSFATGFDSDYRYLFISNNYWNLDVYSLINPSNPQLIYSFPQQPYSGFDAPFVNGDLLYLGSMDSTVFGIKIFDIADILEPVELASWSYERPIRIVYVANNHIYAIDSTPRLLILDYLF